MRASKNMTRLFVYGTLAPGKENAHIMDGMSGTWTQACVRGHLVQTGWGVHSGHPGLTPDKTGPLVLGLVFDSPDLPAHWDRLDKFEGADYKRVPIMARLEAGKKIKVHIYSVS